MSSQVHVHVFVLSSNVILRVSRSRKPPYLAGLLDGRAISQGVSEGNTELDNVGASLLEREHNIDGLARLWVSGSNESHKGRAL